MIKAGLIGNGHIAGSHRKGYRRIASENGPVIIEACCDIRAERLENLSDERVYSDIDTMLAAEQGKLEYVDICLPTFLHADVAIRAMKAGFNVLCEKPMALNESLAA